MGAVLFHLLTGARRRLPARTPRRSSAAHPGAAAGRQPSREGIPPWLAGIVVRCLAKHPDDRYPTARALLDALRAGRIAGPGGVVVHRTTDPGTVEEAPTEEFAAGPDSARHPAAPRRPAGVAVGAALVAAAVVTTLLTPAGRSAARRAGGAQPLVEPIVVTVDDSGRMVAPERDVRIPVRSGAPLEAHWAMVRPSHLGRVLGQGVEGAIVADGWRASGGSGWMPRRAGWCATPRWWSTGPIVASRSPSWTASTASTAAARSSPETRSAWGTIRSVGAAWCGSAIRMAGPRAIPPCWDSATA
jgi:hypothetical protein